MRRLTLALLAALAPGLANAGTLAVSLDQAVRLTLPSPAQDVIVGNPSIADVTVADDRHLVITGKSYGVTNLIITNRAGRTVFNDQIVVSTPDQSRVTIYNGALASSYACAPRCEQAAAGQLGPAIAAPVSQVSSVTASPASP